MKELAAAAEERLALGVGGGVGTDDLDGAAGGTETTADQGQLTSPAAVTALDRQLTAPAAVADGQQGSGRTDRDRPTAATTVADRPVPAPAAPSSVRGEHHHHVPLTDT